MNKRGKLIVIEGTDASGKETQSKFLEKKLISEGRAVNVFSFPRYETPTGDILKRYLGKPPYEQEFGSSNELNPRAASVFYALDRFAAKPEIMDCLNKGNIVIANRYVESNMGHQGGKIKNSEERRKFIDWLDKLEYGSKFKLPRPDGIIFLYMPYQVALELRKGREGAADGHESNPEHLQNAEKAYLELAERFNWFKIECAPEKNICSLKGIEQIAEEIYRHVSLII